MWHLQIFFISWPNKMIILMTNIMLGCNDASSVTARGCSDEE